MIYITPEVVICNPYWRELLRTDAYQKNLVALVVDEAHCVKNGTRRIELYGEDYNTIMYLYRGEQFRKAYSRIGEIFILPPSVHVMALIATATRHTK